MFTKVLLATDGSACALKAAQAAAAIARKFHAELILLNVSPSLSQVFPTYATAGLDMPVGLVADAQRKVTAATGRAVDEEGVAYIVRIETGVPADRIVSVAEEEGVDLIVLGSRGLSGVKSVLLGSVSDAVIHHAHCPVLVVK